jgi:hypothetical protein
MRNAMKFRKYINIALSEIITHSYYGQNELMFSLFAFFQTVF